MEEKRIKTINMLTLAFGIAFMPPVWAVLAPFIGVDTGAVALICAGLFVANGNRRQDTFKISLGLLLGDIWGLKSCRGIPMWSCTLPCSFWEGLR